MAPSETDQMFAMLREVRDISLNTATRLDSVEKQLEKAANERKADQDDILALKLAHAKQQGMMTVLLYLVPGGPALVTLIGGIAWWVSER